MAISNTFIDKGGSASRKMLEYITGSLSQRGYVTSSIPAVASTDATRRIGTFLSKSLLEPKEYETTDLVGGVRFNSITLFGNGDATEDEINNAIFNGFRIGKNIKDFVHFGGATNVRPMIRISPEGFFEESFGDRINHYASFNNFGMGENYKIVNESYEFIPFTDFGKLIPADLIGKSSVFAYPFVHNAVRDLDHYLDPSSPGSDGAIDVFEVRASLTNTSVSDIRVYGCHGSYQGGGIELTKKGGIAIVNKYEINKISNELFLDSQEVEFGGHEFPKIGVTGSSGYKFSLPGFVDMDSQNLATPFNETQDYISESYSFQNNSMTNFLSSSRNRISEIGTRFKSATNGLIFGESNALGTDSIAFGGFKK